MRRHMLALLVIPVVGIACGGAENGKPVIHSMVPLSGPPGTVITLGGMSLVHVERVTVGGIPARFAERGSTEVIVAVPMRARSGVVALTTDHGATRTDLSFSVKGRPLPGAENESPAELPVIVGVAPLSARPGMIVEARGQRLDGVRSVRIGGVTAPFAANGTTLSVVVPPRARSGTLVVVTSHGTVAEPGFTVVR